MHSYLNSWYKATKRNNELKFTTQSAFPLKKKLQIMRFHKLFMVMYDCLIKMEVLLVCN